MSPRLKPVTEIKREATRIIARLRKERVPIVITEHGKSAAVLLDVASYEELQRRLAILEGIARGERAYAEGRTFTNAQARKRLSKWLAKRG